MSSTSDNHRINHEFVSKEYISISTRYFEKNKSKVTRAHTQSGQYHSTVEILDL